MKQRYFINGVEANEPINYPELEIELNYDKDSNSQTVSINQFEFGVGDGRTGADSYLISKTQFDKGLTGDIGVFEGQPLKIILDNERDKTYVLFDGYLDLAQAQYGHDTITAPAVEQGKLDWLNGVADSFTFEYLASEAGNLKINTSHYVGVPYCIEKKQNASDIILASLTVFVVTDKIQEQIVEINELIAEASANPDDLSIIIKLVARIIYISALMVSLVGLIIKLYNLLIQPVKYHYGMYAKDLLRIGLDHLGLGFQSSILETHPFDKLLIVPEKYNLKDNSGLLDGVEGLIKPNQNESEGYYKGTFGDFLRTLKLMFNAKIVIDEGKLYFERYNFDISKGTYIIPDVYDSRYKFSLNYDDLKATYIISFLTDISDRNTIQEYRGTSVQITVQPNTINNKTMLLLKNLEEVRIPFALARRKTELSKLEKLISAFLKVLNAAVNTLVFTINLLLKFINIFIRIANYIIKIFRTIGIKLSLKIPEIPTINFPTFGKLIEDRKGMMKMESDFINVPKMLLVANHGNPRNNKPIDNNETLLSALYLWNNFHYYKSFLPQKDSKGNQYTIHELEEVPFTFSDFEQCRTNRKIFDAQGKEGLLINLKFNPNKGTVTGRYMIQKQYTNNLNESIYEPDGQ